MQAKNKKRSPCFPNTELIDPSWKDSLSCEGDTLLRLSFLRLCHGEIGTRDFCLSNLSELGICPMFFSYQLSQGDSWLICFNRYSLPSLADSSVPHCVLRAVAGELLTSSPFGCLTISPAAILQIAPKPQMTIRRVPGRHRPVVQGRNNASSRGWCRGIWDKQ